MSDPLTIGKVARRAGVNVETVRYYERRGLLPAPPRTDSGYRQYDAGAVRRIAFIKSAQGLGFTLEEIGTLLALRVAPDAGCDAVEAQARSAMSRIEAKMDALTRMHGALAGLAGACRQRRRTDDCPILKSLEGAADGRLSPTTPRRATPSSRPRAIP